MPWAAGDHIILREIYKDQVWAVRPVVVAQDDPELLVCWTPVGTKWKVPATAQGERLDLPTDTWTLIEIAHTVDMLRLVTPGEAHSVLLFFDSDRFLGWYVYLEEPLRRTPLGFDYLDQKLDLIIKPDGTWEWKDEDHLAEAVYRGLIGQEEAAAIRLEGARVLDDYRANRSLFSDGWERFRPDASWTTPGFPDGWDRVLPKVEARVT